MFLTRTWLAGLFLSFVAAIGAWGAAVPDTPEPVPQALRDQILEIARTYERFGRVDDEHRWAPGLCRMPNPGRVYPSRSKDAETHGQKLYSLFAKNRLAYLEMAKNQMGQIIIKESWLPEEMKTPPDRRQLMGQRQQLPRQPIQGAITGPVVDLMPLQNVFDPYVQKDGKWFHAAKKAGLYIMLKVEPETPTTDQGWIYATVTADAKTVTAAGKIASCMGCHQQAKRDRLFGIKAN